MARISVQQQMLLWRRLAVMDDAAIIAEFQRYKENAEKVPSDRAAAAIAVYEEMAFEEENGAWKL
jgi:hypothetical protein